MKKIKAIGLYKGTKAVVSCVEKNKIITVYLNGVVNDNIKNMLYELSMEREFEFEDTHAYCPTRGTMESYWIVLHESFFDDAPESVEVEGKLDLKGAPYIDEPDDDGTVY